ncbi:MAG: hypothetical protein WDO15_18200 [Bacteroidota bacterium]
MCIATLESFAQCPPNFNRPDIQIQWRSNNAFDFGHRASTTDYFNYIYDFGTVDEELRAIQQIEFANCASTAQPAPFADASRFKVQIVYCTGTSAADWDFPELGNFASTIGAVPANGTLIQPFNLVFHPVGPSTAERKVILLISYRDTNWGDGEGLA